MDKNSRFDTNNYEFNTESKNGIYLIHGFTNSTYEVKMLAEYLSKKGYHTVAENLPGHGTTVEECNRVKYTDWITFIQKGVAKLASTCDKIHIIGSSMGAVLTLHLSTIFPVDSIVVIAPVFQFKSEFKARILVPLFNNFIPLTKKSSQYSNSNNIEFYGYTYYPNRALNEFRKLTNVVRKKLPNIKCPTLMLFSKADQTCIMDNYDIVNSSIGTSTKENLILDKTSHTMLDDQSYIDEHQLIYATINQFIDRF